MTDHDNSTLVISTLVPSPKFRPLYPNRYKTERLKLSMLVCFPASNTKSNEKMIILKHFYFSYYIFLIKGQIFGCSKTGKFRLTKILLGSPFHQRAPEFKLKKMVGNFKPHLAVYWLGTTEQQHMNYMQLHRELWKKLLDFYKISHRVLQHSPRIIMDRYRWRVIAITICFHGSETNIRVKVIIRQKHPYKL